MDRWLGEFPVDCPFCGERITLLVDGSAGSQSYIEDCQVCCRPIEVEIDAEGGEVQDVRVSDAG